MAVEEKILSVVKKAAAAVYDSKKPLEAVIGRIRTVSPLSADCGGLVNIPSELLVLCKGAEKEIEEGTPVIMLRAQGGQRFIIIGAVSDMGVSL